MQIILLAECVKNSNFFLGFLNFSISFLISPVLNDN